MLENFNGLTFFELFKTNSDYIDILINKIIEEGIKNKLSVDKNGIESDNIIIR